MPLMPETERTFGDGGVQFQHGFVTTPQCCPSRASIFSGEYSHNTGITHNNGTGFDAKDTWERKLHAHGYYTGIIGKYLNGLDTLDAPYFDFRNRGERPAGDEIARFDPQVDRFLTTAEIHDRRPWALEVASYSPHSPWTMSPPNPLPIPRFDPPPSYQEANRTDKDPAVQAISHPDRQIQAAYYGQQMEVQEADREVHHVFRDMRADGEARNTIRVFPAPTTGLRGDMACLARACPIRSRCRFHSSSAGPDTSPGTRWTPGWPRTSTSRQRSTTPPASSLTTRWTGARSCSQNLASS